MCIPSSSGGSSGFASASLALQGIGAVTSVLGSYYAAKAQKSALRMQADAARTSARLAELNANTALQTSEINADMAEELAGLNSDWALAIGDINAGLATTLSDLNMQVADGNYNLILGRGELEAAVAEGNARILEANAQDALRVGQQQEQQSRLQYANLKGSQRARLAANGLALDEGSALRILTDTDYLSDVDANTLHANAVREAMGYRTQASAMLTEADAARIRARTEGLTAKAEALGAKLSADIGVLNMRLSSSFEALQSRISGRIEGYNLREQGRTESRNYRQQALGLTNQALALSAGARGISPFGTAATTLISEASGVANRWYTYNRAGAFG